MAVAEAFQDNTISFITHSLGVEIHRHASWQLVYAQDHPFDSLIAGVSYRNIVGFLIKPQVPHRCTSVVGPFTIVNAEPHSRVGQCFLSLLKGERTTMVFGEPQDLLSIGFDLPPRANIIEKLRALIVHYNQPNSIDERVLSVLNAVHTSGDGAALTIATLAETVALSTSRLSGLFKEHMGSSLSQFLLWNRLKTALRLLLKDETKTITEVALETGFYDAANFNKYMQRMIGVPPRLFRKNSKLIQVF